VTGSRPRNSQNQESEAPPSPSDKRRARTILKKLREVHSDARCSLSHDNAFQLIVATLLSAQCTDARVNKVTPALFKKYRTPGALGRAVPEDLEGIIYSTGFYKAKARNLIGLGRKLEEEFGGKVPETMENLLSLPGVARKTANVVLGVSFAKAEGVVVDTHVKRIAKRLGFTRHEAPQKIEKDLMALFPKSTWIDLSHILIYHGRRLCGARKPMCDSCPVNKQCSGPG